MRDPQEYIHSVIDGISWSIVEGCEEELLSALRPGWSQGKLIRATPHRRVFRVAGKQRSFLLKHFVPSGIWGVLKAVLRGSPAVREWKALREAQRRGLPVPAPVALGKGAKIWNRESLLVTEFIEGSIPLSDFLFGVDRQAGSARRRAVQEVARLIRRAHDAGFYQPDLHTENILVKPSPQTLKLFLIDLQRVTFSPSLSLHMRWGNLSVLNGGCAEARPADRASFLKTYLSGPPPLITDFRKVAGRLERAGQRHRRRLWRSREKRCLAENREFLKVRAGELSGFARRDSWSSDLQNLLAGLRGHLKSPGIRYFRESPITAVGVFELGGDTFHIEERRSRGLGHAIKNLIRPFRTRREWVVANRKRMRGISVPLPVAYLERRRFGVPLESYLIAKVVSGARIS